MNFRTWIIATILGSLAGWLLGRYAPHVSMLGDLGVTLIVMLLALRISDLGGWR